ncbi:unnamed protein product [Cylindrotheca closterium]|uniref:Uncharacterized protein n=1 Tax=Cylindrotheca closterium TaxID=2856 RepID=A0AAD2CTF4_9STRA|nr:unnamed protein product [Cylindrotheca closterium]
MAPRVAAEISFEQNTICNPQYVFDHHKPVKLAGYMMDAEWEEFVEDIENTLVPAKKFQRSITAISATFLVLYIVILISSLTILKEVEPSVIQLSVMIAVNALFILSLFRAEKGVRDLAKRRLRKVLVAAGAKHSKLSFALKQQERGKGIFMYLEICILEPLAAHGGWDEGSDGEVVLNLEMEEIESA